jgi:CubicO group peptidase (beta-lactamase class C family)
VQLSNDARITGTVTDRPTVQGTCDPRFDEVRAEFARNFAERRELGAAVCVIVDGEPVVDLWGGIADDRTQQPWEADTMNVIMSCSKGVIALCAHILIDRGQLDVDKPVAHYWPEFAQHGKSQIKIRQVLSHQSGVAHVDAPIPPGRIADFDLMVRLTAETKPFWDPGTRIGYHGLTGGWIIGELVRRITGKTPGMFLREEVTGPLGDVDVWLGLPEELESRMSRTVMFDIPKEIGMSPAVWRALSDPTSRGHKVITAILRVPALRRAIARNAIRQSEKHAPGQGLPPPFVHTFLDPRSAAFAFLTNMGQYTDHIDTRFSHAGELPAAGICASARGLAGLYAPLALGGEHRGVRLVSQAAISRMRVAQAATDLDAVLGGPTSYTLGFAKSWPTNRRGSGVIIGEDAFGTPGAGGQLGFADPSYRVSFAYVMNRHGVGTGLNERGQSLVDATYRSLGSPGQGPGYWRRTD